MTTPLSGLPHMGGRAARSHQSHEIAQPQLSLSLSRWQERIQAALRFAALDDNTLLFVKKGRGLPLLLPYALKRTRTCAKLPQKAFFPNSVSLLGFFRWSKESTQCVHWGTASAGGVRVDIRRSHSYRRLQCRMAQPHSLNILTDDYSVDYSDYRMAQPPQGNTHCRRLQCRIAQSPQGNSKALKPPVTVWNGIVTSREFTDWAF